MNLPISSCFQTKSNDTLFSRKFEPPIWKPETANLNNLAVISWRFQKIPAKPKFKVFGIFGKHLAKLLSLSHVKQTSNSANVNIELTCWNFFTGKKTRNEKLQFTFFWFLKVGLNRSKNVKMSALFNFQALLTVILLLICTCAYIRSIWPSILDRKKTGPLGIFWKCARIGERMSPYVAVFCIGMAFHTLFLQ